MQEPHDKKRFFFSTDAFYYFELLKQQWRLILVFCVSAVSCSLLLTFLTAEKYQAETGIFYRPQESTVLRLKTTESFGAPVPSPPFKVINQTLYDIVKSDVILRPVVLKLELYKKEPLPHDSWFRYMYSATKDWIKEFGSDCISLLKHGRIIREEPVSGAIRNLRNKISLSTKRDSYILTLSVKDTRAERAAKIVDAIGENLVSWLKSQDVSSSEQKLSQLKEQLSTKEQQLANLRNDRARIMGVSNLASLPEETDKSISNLYEMELDSARLSSLIQEKQQKIDQLDSEARQTKIYLSPEDMKRLKSQKLFETVELKGLIARLENMKRSIAQVKVRLSQFPDLQKKLEQLDMLISASAHEYQQLSDIYLESTQNSITARSEIRVIHAASVPTSPVQPIKIYHTGVTALLSLIVSVSLIYVLGFFNIRILFASKGALARESRSNEFLSAVPDEP